MVDQSTRSRSEVHARGRADLAPKMAKLGDRRAGVPRCRRYMEGLTEKRGTSWGQVKLTGGQGLVTSAGKSPLAVCPRADFRGKDNSERLLVEILELKTKHIKRWSDPAQRIRRRRYQRASRANSRTAAQTPAARRAGDRRRRPPHPPWKDSRNSVNSMASNHLLSRVAKHRRSCGRPSRKLATLSKKITSTWRGELLT